MWKGSEGVSVQRAVTGSQYGEEEEEEEEGCDVDILQTNGGFHNVRDGWFHSLPPPHA